MERINAIFWDNDGVLVDTEPLYFETTREVFASIGVPLTEDDYIDLFLVKGSGAWHLVEAQGRSPAEIERLRDERNARYAERLAQRSHAVEGIADVLSALHGQYTMGVVTTCRRDHFEVMHRHTGLLKYFDFVLTHDDYARTKPHPDPYLAALARCGAAPASSVAIEDSSRGLAAAKAAGIRCLVVPGPLTERRLINGAERILGSVADIPAAIAELS
jgi:HAD superfamily hydrolase (TIGR01509 family)